MKTDLYTRIVLTSIAVALSINLTRDVPLFPVAAAQDYDREIARVPIPVNLVRMSGSDLSLEGALPVRVGGAVQVVEPVQVVIGE